MAMQIKMAFPTEDDDDLDVDALRLAALSTLKKTSAPPALSHSSTSIHNVPGGPRPKPQGGPHVPQNRGRGRGIMRGGRGGRGPRGNFAGYHNNAQNFFPNRPAGNSNLITIVPTVPDEPETSKENQLKGSKSNPNFSGSGVVDSTHNEEENVPAKFRRLDDDSESEESDDDTNLKLGSDAESSVYDEEDKENSGNTDDESEKDADIVTLQQDEDERDNSLERLMQELEDEISDAPKDKKPVLSSKDKSKVEKVPRVKKVKKEKPKKERQDKEISFDNDAPISVLSPGKTSGPANQSVPKINAVHQRKLSTSPTLQQPLVSRTQSRSPLRYDPVSRDPSPESSNLPSKLHSSSRPFSPQASRSPHRTSEVLRSRSPLKSRSPRSRSPVQSRSPLRSPRRSLSRSPRRSPLRSHPASARSPVFVGRRSSRSPLRSPRRSPHYLPPRAISPGRLPPLRSRSRSPRLSPGRVGYVRRSSRSRSRTPPLGHRRPISPNRRLPPLRRSLSRSPGGRLYMTRRSRSPRRSPSPRSRRSPLYVKKLSPKRRSVSPRRRSISPRRRSISPRRRSISPRRRPVSPRRRPGSPSWSRLSPVRTRSPVASFSQRPLSPRRRSPYGDAYPARRSPSPSSRKYSPPQVHRGASPQRSYRSPSPVTRTTLRRRSPVPIAAPPRRLSPPHRGPSPSFRLSPSKPTRAPASPLRIRDKPRQLSPLPPVSRNVQRVPSPRRQRSPVSFSRGHHNKALSPVPRVSPNIHSLKRSHSPQKEAAAPISGRAASPNDSISLSPSPERLPASKSDERNRARKSHPLGDNHESKRSRTDLRNVLPRRKDVVKESESNVVTRSDELTKKEKKERKRARREKKEHKKESHQNSGSALEARRRKFESNGPVEIAGKKIRLRNVASEPVDAEEQEIDSTEVEVNIEKEKERELKEANEVDESILDRELMGGVDLLWSDEEEEEEEDDEPHVDTPAPVSNVQFKRTFNMPSGSGNSGKENIPEDSNDSKKDDEEPTSTTGSPPGNLNRDEDSAEEERYVSDISGDELQLDEEPQDNWPKTNRELKEFIISQAKGTVQARPHKTSRKESSNKRKSHESDDLRAELSRRRAERLTKANNCPELPAERLLQSALQGVGVKPRREKSHRRRTRSPFEDDLDQQESDGRRVLVLRRAAELKEPAINITISKVESSKDSGSLKMGGKLPIHMRLGTGKRSDDSPKKVKLKRNITVGRKKQV